MGKIGCKRSSSFRKYKGVPQGSGSINFSFYIVLNGILCIFRDECMIYYYADDRTAGVSDPKLHRKRLRLWKKKAQHLANIKHYLRHGNMANKNEVSIYHDIFRYIYVYIYIYIYIYKEKQKHQKMFSAMSNLHLQTNGLVFRVRFPKWTKIQGASGYSRAPRCGNEIWNIMQKLLLNGLIQTKLMQICPNFIRR